MQLDMLLINALPFGSNLYQLMKRFYYKSIKLGWNKILREAKETVSQKFSNGEVDFIIDQSKLDEGTTIILTIPVKQ